MKYQEYDIRKAAKYVGLKTKELKQIRDSNVNMFESIMLGAITLSDGIEFGAALFMQRHAWKPTTKVLLDRVVELEKLASKE